MILRIMKLIIFAPVTLMLLFLVAINDLAHIDNSVFTRYMDWYLK